MVDKTVKDVYNVAITRRRIAMPKFRHESIGNFYIEAKPVGRLRKNALIQRLVPYLAGDRPNIEITIEKLPNTLAELEFNAHLFLIDPKDISDTTYNPVEHIEDARTPFRWKIQSKVMLRTDGSYIYDITVMPKQQEDKEKIIGGSIQIAQIPTVTMEFLFIKLVYVIVGAIIGVLLTLLFG